MRGENAQRFLAKLAGLTGDLPYSPDILSRVLGQAGPQSAATLREIAEVIGHDQGLTTKILITANSAFYGLQAQVASISRAITVLGLTEIKNIVLAVGIQGLTRGKTPAPGFDIKAYWRHQLRVAAAARLLSGMLGLDNPDAMFTCGLLHDLGKLLMAVHAPDDYSAVAALSQDENIPWFAAEDTHWGLEHGLSGAMALASWNLPAELTEPINWHHSPLLATGFKKEAVTLSLADALVLSIFEPAAALALSVTDTLTRLRLNADEVITAIAEQDKTEGLEAFAAGLAA